MKDYIDFTQADLIEDEYFLEWVSKPSEKSQIFWEEFIKKYPEKKKEIETAKLIIKSMVPDETDFYETEIDSLWTSIKKSIDNRKKRNWRLWYPVAAAGILIFIVSIWWINSENHKNYDVVDYSQLLPTRNATQDVELILGDQTKVKISEKESELKYNSNGKLVINSAKSIMQEAVRSTSSQVSINTIVVPRGKRANITFTDGTTLWLNSGSSAVYPVEFTGRKREVYIKGEGYLEVAHDESRPFIVKTDQMDIQVLGTSFNICAYPEDASTKVVLVEGKVVARCTNNPEVILLPNQMISFSNETKKTDVTEVNVEDYISWKDGWLLCNSEELGSLVEKLERYYDQKIIFSDEDVRLYRLSGKLDLKDDLNQVLQVIATTAPVEIQVKNEAICISNKKLK
jgi:ferric-dicitrate binding protein FerR (iron transport regulator)